MPGNVAWVAGGDSAATGAATGGWGGGGDRAENVALGVNLT